MCLILNFIGQGSMFLISKFWNVVITYVLIEIFFYRQYSVDYKLETYLKIARLYLENDDPVQAEAYINRASLLQVISLQVQIN